MSLYPPSLFAQRLRLSAGSVVFSAGDARDYAYIIEQGAVELFRSDENGGRDQLITLGAGEIFGEMALISDGPRLANAMAKTDVLLYVVPPDLLQERMRGLDPIISLVFNLLIERYRKTRIKHPDEIEHLHVADFAEVSRPAFKKLRIEQDIRRGIDAAEFKPYLQPIVSLKDGKTVGYETLVRWHHPTRGVIMPVDFIPVAERTSAIKQLDHLVLQSVCELLMQRDDPPLISVNLSGVTVAGNDVVDMVNDVLERTKYPAGKIRLELTESAYMGQPDKAAVVMDELRTLGLGIALDDFGVGYSSLGYLTSLPIDVLKLDRGFIHHLHERDKQRDIVESMIHMSKRLNMQVVAEGVEKTEEALVLSAFGCPMGQGYLYGRPMMAELVGSGK